MSKKYYDRLLMGSGSTTKEVKSEFGEKMLKMMGWSKGEGLGRTMEGIKDCIQIKRRDEHLGMGAEMETPTAKFKWNDKFWDDQYNEMAAKFSANVPKGKGPANLNDSFDKKIDLDSSDDDSSAEKSNESSCSSFDGEIEIETSKPLFEAPVKKVAKLDKSKAIKKEKKEKKEKKQKKSKK